jgi:quinol monooxygenase YgiN
VIVVNAVVESTEADIAALKSAIATMESKSRAEPGCLDYTFSVELNRPHVVRITEKWPASRRWPNTSDSLTWPRSAKP